MVLSHPSKTRIIAEAKIKTDKVDSKNLAKLLRADFLPQSYIPTEQRDKREQGSAEAESATWKG